MPYFHMFESRPPYDASSPPQTPCASSSADATTIASEARRHRIRVKNRRKRFLDLNPSYFGPDLEIADPLLYDRLIRRFQSAKEREAEGRSKGFSGILEADITRGEARLERLAHPDPSLMVNYRRGPDGEILEEEEDDVPQDKEEGMSRWREIMEMRFLEGNDGDFEYRDVDENDEYDDLVEEDRERQEAYFDEEPPRWELEDGKAPQGQTGILDY